MTIRRAAAPIVVLLLMAAFMLCAPERASADEGTTQWTLQVDPLTTALGFVHLQVEYVPEPSWSVYLGPSLKLFPGVLAEDGDVAYRGLGAEFGGRFYIDDRGPAGIWLLLRGVLAHLSTTEGPERTSLGGYVSLLFGHTWIFADLWVVSLGGGVQYLNYQVAGAGPVGVLPAAHTTIGVAF